MVFVGGRGCVVVGVWWYSVGMYLLGVGELFVVYMGVFCGVRVGLGVGGCVVCVWVVLGRS